MLPEKLKDVLKHEGVVAIATQGQDGAHLVNSWNSYIQITPQDNLLIPAGYMHKTEENINQDNRVLVTVGSREVAGFNGPGTGFLIQGTATFHKTGQPFEIIKEKFSWARAALEVKVESANQTL